MVGSDVQFVEMVHTVRVSSSLFMHTVMSLLISLVPIIHSIAAIPYARPCTCAMQPRVVVSPNDSKHAACEVTGRCSA